jgi:hypothetical protein
MGETTLDYNNKRKRKKMTKYKTLDEAFASIDYGMCSLCQAEHEFPDVKCEFVTEGEEE